jgi:hypothetical protein
MLPKRTINIVLLVFICFVSSAFLFFPQTSLSKIDFDDVLDERTFQDEIKSANNDTSPPIITFIQPDTDNITIKSKFYDIIVNIEDDNPPLPGNVTLEISNTTSSLFNGSMSLFDENEWIFAWDNITSYPNKEIYIFKVVAKDSSTNENIGFSEVRYVYVEQSSSPGVLNVLFYVIVVSVLIGAILIYYNRKRVRRLSSNEIERSSF